MLSTSDRVSWPRACLHPWKEAVFSLKVHRVITLSTAVGEWMIVQFVFEQSITSARNAIPQHILPTSFESRTIISTFPQYSPNNLRYFEIDIKRDVKPTAAESICPVVAAEWPGAFALLWPYLPASTAASWATPWARPMELLFFGFVRSICDLFVPFFGSQFQLPGPSWSRSEVPWPANALENELVRPSRQLSSDSWHSQDTPECCRAMREVQRRPRSQSYYNYLPWH